MRTRGSPGEGARVPADSDALCSAGLSQLGRSLCKSPRFPDNLTKLQRLQLCRVSFYVFHGRYLSKGPQGPARHTARLVPFYREENSVIEAERLGDLPRVTQLLGVRGGVHSWGAEGRVHLAPVLPCFFL